MVARVALVASVTALIAWSFGGDAFWLCAPAAMLLAARARSGVESIASVVVAVLATGLPLMGDGAPLPLGFAVAGSCVGILHAVRSRFAMERAALRTSAMTDAALGNGI